jgi:hypothetical protein
VTTKKNDKRIEYLMTPVGVAHYPHLFEVDKMAGKYTIQLELAEDDAEALIAKMKDAVKAWGTTDKIPMKVKDGKVLFTFKTKKEPRVVDAQNRPVPSTTRIGSGSKVRIKGSLVPYEGLGGGITAYLNGVQLVDLVEWGGGAGFEAIDGYTVGDDGDVPF